ncbi:hypothetical protein EON67_02450 [archaeon]|nr:MAG: hypothetical protein EON67_02450 [archaeon]
MQGTTLKMALDKVLGKGVFGTVMEGTIMETGERVAIKRVKQDARFKNRELPIMKSLHHPNIVALKHYFFQDGKEEGELYLNLVMEYMPETLYSVTHSLSKLGQIAPQVNIKVCGTPPLGRVRMTRDFDVHSKPAYRCTPPALAPVQLYFYQLCRGLAYLHSTGVCHRDVKPQNVLVNPKTHVVKLCDFGSAKALKASEPSVAYICSRFYRAPELTLGQTIYSVAVDMWAAGCVLGEMMLGHALFRGESGVLQIVEIVKVRRAARPRWPACMCTLPLTKTSSLWLECLLSHVRVRMVLLCRCWAHPHASSSSP